MKKIKKLVEEKTVLSLSMYDIESRTIQGLIDTLQTIVKNHPTAGFTLDYKNVYENGDQPDISVIVKEIETDEAFAARKEKELAREKGRLLKRQVAANKRAQKEKEKAERMFKVELEELKRLQEKYKDVEVK
jgi:predicted N-formylglutamate amidohydrolase